MIRKQHYRDMEKCRITCNRCRKKNYARGNFSEGKHEWTVEEIDRVLKHEIPDRELAKELKTSVQAIQVVRCRSKKKMIEKFIPYGHENAVTTETLERVTGLSPRQIRKEVSNSKYCILNMQDGKGYFRFDPHTKAERELAKKYSAQEKSRGWASIMKAMKVDKKLRKTDASEFNGNMYQMARLLVGLSREYVAAQMEISTRRLGRIENGEFDFTDDERKKFEEVVGIEM